MNSLIKLTSILLTTLFLSLYKITSPHLAFASPIINEVYPNQITSEKEWIEIYNDSEKIIDLNDWKLMDTVSSPSIIFEFKNIEIDNWTLEPYKFLVIELESNKLNNSGDTVQLLNSNNEIIDQFEYFISQQAKSFSKINQSNQSTYEIILTSPTKGFQNTLETNADPSNQNDNIDSELEETPETTTQNNSQDNSQVSPAQTVKTLSQNYPELIIYEVMSCPNENDSEWIKIENKNNETINLLNWKITDKANNSLILTLDEYIEANTTHSILLSKNILNNSGDVVNLYNPNEILVDKFEFKECEIGKSILAKGSTSIITDNQSSSNNLTNANQNTMSKISNNELDEQKSKLLKINSLLKIVNPDKSLTKKINNYLSKQIVLTKNSLTKSSILSVIIGGTLITSSGLYFIKNEKI